MPSLKEEIQQLQKVLSDVSIKLTEMQTAVEAAEQEKVVMKDKMVELEGKLAAAEEANIVSNKAIEELQTKLASVEEKVADIAGVPTQEVIDEVKEEEPITKPVPKPRNSIDKSSDSSTTEIEKQTIKALPVIPPKPGAKKSAESKEEVVKETKDVTGEQAQGSAPRKSLSEKTQQFQQELATKLADKTAPVVKKEDTAAELVDMSANATEASNDQATAVVEENTTTEQPSVEPQQRKSIVGGVQLPQLSNVVLKTTQKGQELFAPHEQSSADVDDQVAVIGGEGQ